MSVEFDLIADAKSSFARAGKSELLRERSSNLKLFKVVSTVCIVLVYIMLRGTDGTYELRLFTSSIAAVRKSVGIPYLKHIALIFAIASFLSNEPRQVLLPPVVKIGVTMFITFFAILPFGSFFAF